MHAFCPWPQLKGQSVLGMTANKIHKDKLRFKTVDLWLGTTPVDADVQKYVLVAEVDTAELDFLHLALVAVALEWVPLVLKAEGAFQVSEAVDKERDPLVVIVSAGMGSLQVSVAAAVVVGVNQVLTVVVVAEVTLQA